MSLISFSHKGYRDCQLKPKYEMEETQNPHSLLGECIYNNRLNYALFLAAFLLLASSNAFRSRS